MIYNIEISLEEMQKQALEKGELIGLEKGKTEVARELIDTNAYGG